MKSKWTILVSGASGIVGYGILKSLRASDLSLTLIGSTIYDDSIAPAFCDIFELAPPTDAPEYLQWLIDCIKKYHIDMIVPSIEADMLFWNLHGEKLTETGTFVLLNQSALIESCRDKWIFYQCLMGGAPQYAIASSIDGSFEEISAKYGVPFLLKPRRGYGSQGIHRIYCKEDFAKYFAAASENGFMIQPIIGDNRQEFTVSAFFSSDSKLLAFQELRRELSPLGFTQSAEVCEIPGIKQVLMELAKVFSPVGPTNFQFRLDKGQLKLLEINPRISSSSSMRCKVGYNESAMAVKYFLCHQKIVQPKIAKGRIVRYTEDYYFPEN